MTTSLDTRQGWMPEATKVAVPATNYSTGNAGRKAAVIHIGEGSVSAILGEFTPAGKEKSAHFVVSDAGQIWQCVSVFDSAYANGLSWDAAQHCWVDPQGHLLKAPNPSPSWLGLTPPINPNFTTISIEREGHYQDLPSAAENAAVVRVLRYVQSQFPALPSWSFMQTLIGHCHISPVSKPNCPGPHVDYAALAAAANAPLPPKPPSATPYILLSPCTPLTARDPAAPLATGVVLNTGDRVNVGDITNGWLWVSDRADTAPGIGFIPQSYARPV